MSTVAKAMIKEDLSKKSNNMPFICNFMCLIASHILKFTQEVPICIQITMMAICYFLCRVYINNVL